MRERTGEGARKRMSSEAKEVMEEGISMRRKRSRGERGTVGADGGNGGPEKRRAMDLEGDGWWQDRPWGPEAIW